METVLLILQVGLKWLLRVGAAICGNLVGILVAKNKVI